MHKALEDRRVEREKLLARARKFAEEAAKALGAITVWAYGSVARGISTFGPMWTLCSSRRGFRSIRWIALPFFSGGRRLE